MARTAQTRSDRGRAAARELARTPVSDPYRGQLHDPFADEPASQVQADEITPMPAGLPMAHISGLRETAPPAAIAAGILAIMLGCFAALAGFVLIAAITLENSFGAPDRSFYRGTDAAHLVLGVLDFILAGAGALGGIALMTGRLAGRMYLTVFGWAMLGEAAYWFTGPAPTEIPLVVATLSGATLWLGYHGSVTRWLGVLPPPQPE